MVPEDNGEAAELKRLQELSLAEPSPATDRSICSRARLERCRGRRRGRWILALRLAAAAALVLLAPAYFLVLAPRRETTAIIVPGRSPAEVRAAIENLRSDLAEIHEMSDLIETEGGGDRETILARVKACLLDLDRLERKISTGNESSFLPEDWRKEDNA